MLPDAWRDHVAAAVAAMESAARQSPQVAADPDRQARLRMLYLLAGRRDDALKPISSAPPSVQDFWRRELNGLSVWLDAQRVSDQTRRAGEAKPQLAAALSTIGALAPLTVRNMAFVSKVDSYGMFTSFDKYEFAPDQEVLLYAEVENFSAGEGPKGFHTALKGSYQILDDQGRQVASRNLGTTEEDCRNLRRDFFLGYHLRMPKRTRAGKYVLQLTVEDLQGKKVGQSSMEFQITSNPG